MRSSCSRRCPLSFTLPHEKFAFAIFLFTHCTMNLRSSRTLKFAGGRRNFFTIFGDLFARDDGLSFRPIRIEDNLAKQSARDSEHVIDEFLYAVGYVGGGGGELTICRWTFFFLQANSFLVKLNEFPLIFVSQFFFFSSFSAGLSLRRLWLGNWNPRGLKLNSLFIRFPSSWE